MILVAVLIGILLETAQPADLVVRGARVLTLDETRPLAEAIAVRAGKFLVVGSNAEVAPLIGPGTVILDADGKTVVPGFHDAHLHPSPIYSEDHALYVVPAGPEAVGSIEELVASLRRKAERTPEGQWILGRGYQETKLGRHLTRGDLDAASDRHPIGVTHSSGHLTAFNSRALELAGVSGVTSDPPGGSFDREEDGNPTGVARESAAGLVRRSGPPQPRADEEEVLAGLAECFRRYAAKGLTAVQIAGTDPTMVGRLSTLAARGQLATRVYVMLRENHAEHLDSLRGSGALGDDLVGLGAIKLFHGNSLSGQTCWLSEPYEGRPDYFGIPPARSQAELDALVGRLHAAGHQICIHSNGDREIAMVLDAFEKALREHPRADHRHRIEHCSVVNAGLLERIRDLGVVIAPHSYIYEHGDKMEAYGARRWEWMHPARSALDLGIVIAGNSDSPVSPADPLLRIQDMVLRRGAGGKVYGASQRLSPLESLRAWTLGSAFARFADDRMGSITVGKLADFVVLERDPTNADPESIRSIRLERTVVGGRVVYPAASR